MKLVNLGVIKQVTEPTDWVSSVAYSQKSNGRWRVCLDPKDLNRAVKRSHHHTPTLDEITHQFKGSSVFSKIGCPRLLPNGHPVAWGALLASAGDQVSEQVARTGA